MPQPKEIWDALVAQYAEIADRIELAQWDLDNRVWKVALKLIAEDTSGRVFDVTEGQLRRAGSPAEGTAPKRVLEITSDQAAAALRALGERGPEPAAGPSQADELSLGVL